MYDNKNDKPRSGFTDTFNALLKKHGPGSLPGRAHSTHLDGIAERAGHKIGLMPKPEDLMDFLQADAAAYPAAYSPRSNTTPGDPTTWSARELLAHENAKAHKRESAPKPNKKPFTAEELKALAKLNASGRLEFINRRDAK